MYYHMMFDYYLARCFQFYSALLFDAVEFMGRKDEQRMITLNRNHIYFEIHYLILI